MVFVGKTPNRCVVENCKNHSVTTRAKSGISYHKFPTDPNLEEQWISATGKKDWCPQKGSTICSQHFTDNDYIIEGNSRRLLDNAVPTLNIPIDIEEPSVEDLDECLIITSSSNKKHSNKKLQADIDRAQKLLKQRKLIIRKLQAQSRRSAKKIALQNKVLSDLMEIYNLKHSDIAILRTEILKSEKSEKSTSDHEN